MARGCHLTAEDRAELALIANRMDAIGMLNGGFGYKLSSDRTKVCYLRQRGNAAVKSSGNLLALVICARAPTQSV